MQEVLATVRLKTPVSFGDEMIESVEVYQPTGRAMRKMPAGTPTIDDMMNLCVHCTSIPSNKIFDMFTSNDVSRVIEAVMPFFVNGESEELN